MIPLYSIDQAKLFDKIAIEEYKIPSICLMENAARSIFEQIRPIIDTIPNPIVSILAGKGNNAGDGFALARLLLKYNIKVYVFLLFPSDQIKSDALINFSILQKIALKNNNLIIKNVDTHDDLKVLKSSDIIIDAILGTGFSGALPNNIKNIIEYVNTLENQKISIDIPTGLTSNSTGNIIFKADYTISLGVYKKNLFYGKGYEYCGKVINGYLGTPNNLVYQLFTDTFLVEKNDVKKFLPKKTKRINKYSNGRLLIIAGSKEYLGAPQIVANSALYSGAGAVYLAFPENYKMYLNQLIEPVVIGYQTSNGHFEISAFDEIEDVINKSSVIAIGPGISKNQLTIEATFQLFIKYPDKLFVVDADAFPALKILLTKQIKLDNFIITPHYGEFADILGVTTQDLENNILEYASNFVNKIKCHLVLKGAPTLIFTPDNKIYINSIGNEGMAKFGTGDALTGIIASFVLQNKNIDAALISSVYIHSLAADLLLKESSIYSITASDIITYYSKAFQNVLEEQTD